MSFLSRSVSPGQRSNLNVASNCETELQENHPAEAEDKLFLTKKETEATIDSQEQLNAISNRILIYIKMLVSTPRENFEYLD